MFVFTCSFLFYSFPYGPVISYKGGGGGYKMGKLRVRNFLHPPSRQGTIFHAPPPLNYKSWKLFIPPPLQYG